MRPVYLRARFRLSRLHLLAPAISIHGVLIQIISASVVNGRMDRPGRESFRHQRPELWVFHLNDGKCGTDELCFNLERPKIYIGIV